ncbi:hypothetical protein AAHH78_37325, partial [Burkholderia pseudomallei]
SIGRRDTNRVSARHSPLFRPRRVPRAADAFVANHPQAGRPIINECATAGYDRRQRILSGGFPDRRQMMTLIGSLSSPFVR